MRKRWRVVGLIVVVAVGAAGLWEGRRRAHRGLERLPELLTKHLVAGKADALWRDAARGFREATPADALRLRWLERDLGLDGFQRIESVDEVTLGLGASGLTGEVLATLRWGSATTSGRFVFVREDGAWRLLELALPAAPWPEQLAAAGGAR